MGRPSLRFAIYAWSVSLVAVAAVLSASRAYELRFSWLLAGLVVGAVAAELLEVNLRRFGAVSLMYPLAVSGIVLLGPLAGVVITAASSLPYMHPGRIRPFSKTAFNASQVILMALVPGVLYLVAGGQPLASQALSTSSISRQMVPLLLAAWVGVAVNFALVGVGYSLREGVPLRIVWREAASWMLPSQLALGLVGIAIAQVLSDQGSMGFALFIIPLLVARQMYQRTLGLRQAYADTVRSLVAAIEAKDPYTKGHSVRVARFTTALAKAMSLDEQDVERLEIAALLHDLGKIGISRAILSKPSALTPDEYALIKQHPDIAARILESVPFLGDVLPVVQGHHERVDGGGYGQALFGQHIPVGARILAVADCYDAMTAERPYRAALTIEEAKAELERGRGTQFDSDTVDTFLAVVDSIESDASTDGAGTSAGGAPSA